MYPKRTRTDVPQNRITRRDCNTQRPSTKDDASLPLPIQPTKADTNLGNRSATPTQQLQERQKQKSEKKTDTPLVKPK